MLQANVAAPSIGKPAKGNQCNKEYNKQERPTSTDSKNSGLLKRNDGPKGNGAQCQAA